MHTQPDVRLNFLAGAIATVLVQPRVPTGWWLNSGRGVLLTTGVLFTIGLLSALVPRAGSIWSRVIAIGVGSLAGSTVMLFKIGPGNIWPIVLVFAAGLALAAAAMGAGVVVGVRNPRALISFFKSNW